MMPIMVHTHTHTHQKSDTLELIKIKNFCFLKDSIKDVKTIHSEEIFANHISAKRLYPEYIKKYQNQ